VTTIYRQKRQSSSYSTKRAYAGAHLPLLGLERLGGEPLMSVTRGQCDARPMVTFPAARHHRPLAGTKLYCLVTETCVLTTCLTRQSPTNVFLITVWTLWSYSRLRDNRQWV